MFRPWPIRLVIPGGIVAVLMALLMFRRRRPEPEPDVQGPDPRTWDLAFPAHDRGLIHVEDSWTVACPRCELEMVVADRVR